MNVQTHRVKADLCLMYERFARMLRWSMVAVRRTLINVLSIILIKFSRGSAEVEWRIYASVD